MSRRSRDSGVEGVIAIDKPAGCTSYDVLRGLKRTLGTGKLGHTGTLDPMATGVLVVCAGWATRLIPFLSDGAKEYTGTMRLGVTTTTDDREGEVVLERDASGVSDAALSAAAAALTGEIEQVPPAFSAVKVDGRRAYDAARAGEELELAARPATIFRFELSERQGDEVAFVVSVSPGTYIRSLARDLGEDLGCGAHLTSLRRTVNSGFGAESAVALDAVTGPEQLVPLVDALAQFERVTLDATEVARVRNGQTLVKTCASAIGEHVRMCGPDGTLVAVGRVDRGYESTVVRPVRVRPAR